MSKHNDQMLKELFESNLKKQFQNGLAQGAYAMCSIVLEKANDKSLTPAKRISAIKDFCSKMIEPHGYKKEIPNESNAE